MIQARLQVLFLLANNAPKFNKDEIRASVRKLWIRSDVIVIIVLLIVAVSSYFVYMRLSTSQKVKCEILLDGEVAKTVLLDKNDIFSLEQLPNVVFEVKDGSVAFIKSDCPDKVCIKSGYLHIAGQAAACLPNHVAIHISSDNNADAPDIVI